MTLKAHNTSDDIPSVNPLLFWDIDAKAMNWRNDQAAEWILKRVVERGTEPANIKALITFYSLEKLQQIGRQIKYLRFPEQREDLRLALGLEPQEMECYIVKQSRQERLLSLLNSQKIQD